MMSRRLAALRHRYLTSHLVLHGRPAPIHDSTGQQVGHVDLVRLAGGRLQVSGWVRGAAEVTLVQSGAVVTMVPNLHRADVAQVLGGDPGVGFNLSLPCTARMLVTGQAPGLRFAALSGQPPLPSLTLPLGSGRRATLRLNLRLAAGLLGAAPALAGWALTRAPRFRLAVWRRLNLGETVQIDGPLETRLFGDSDDPVAPGAAQRITIVLPVYNAFDLLAEVLTRVVRHTDVPWRLILIEDASPDARVRPFLRTWVRGQPKADITLIENPANLGFIGSVNAGLALARAPAPASDGVPEGPVVLLNADAFVPQGWASRLIRPFQFHPAIASTTPMSNEAEIFSVPVICAGRDLGPGQGDAIDAVAAQFNPEALLSLTPTGVGFCMALGRDWLAKVPTLDPAFGQGYGEEVDWCQKVRALGGRHLVVPGLFVEHRGGSSFGSAQKQARIAANNAIVSARYPQYDAEVQNFVATDPIVTARLALGLAWAGSRGDPVPVYLAHTLGGGAEVYLTQRIATDIEADIGADTKADAKADTGGGGAVVLRVGGARRWQVELHSRGGRTVGDTDDTDFVRRLLDILPARHIVYSCGVGDRDPVTLPGFLAGLKHRPADRIEVLFHDFFPVSPSYTLLDSDGIYRGAVRSGNTDPAHLGLDPQGRLITLDAWQTAWGDLIGAADELRVFSRASADLVAAVWPDHAARITLKPHRVTTLPTRLPSPLPGAAPPTRPVLGVLGGLNFAKGAGVVQALGQILAQHGSQAPFGLVVIGMVDQTYAPAANVQVHGAYRPADIGDLVRRYAITHWLIPSVWPETFSYTTHEALATGLPVLAFDLGAQGAAVGAAANGVCVRLGDGSTPAENVFEEFQRLLNTPRHPDPTKAPHAETLRADRKPAIPRDRGPATRRQ